MEERKRQKLIKNINDALFFIFNIIVFMFIGFVCGRFY
jgi:hypothetical protein